MEKRNLSLASWVLPWRRTSFEFRVSIFDLRFSSFDFRISLFEFRCSSGQAGDVEPTRQVSHLAGELFIHLPVFADRRHSVASGKQIVVAPLAEQPVIWADEVLLGRVLGNLVKKAALEASNAGEVVTVAFENKRQPLFSIHNPSVMPEDVQLRVSSASFSTREGKGRGIGCYSVKLLTEKYLGGRVWFMSGQPEGTTFFLTLPAPGRDVLARAFVY